MGIERSAPLHGGTCSVRGDVTRRPENRAAACGRLVLFISSVRVLTVCKNEREMKWHQPRGNNKDFRDIATDVEYTKLDSEKIPHAKR